MLFGYPRGLKEKKTKQVKLKNKKSCPYRVPFNILFNIKNPEIASMIRVHLIISKTCSTTNESISL